MNLIYPVNFVGYDGWTASGWRQDLSSGDVITRDGEVIGAWRAVDYDTTNPDAGGRYEFAPNGQSDAIVTVSFAILDSRLNTGMALSEMSREVHQWYESQGGTIS